jgi:hypothetical protein
MSSHTRTFVLLALGAVVSACAHSAASNEATKPNPSVITRAEMERARYATLYDVVLALRGQWLQRRGPTTLVGRPAEIQVIAGDLRMGGVESLRRMTSDNVVSIAFVDPVTAAQRWGGSHAQGAIVVTMQADASPQRKAK